MSNKNFYLILILSLLALAARLIWHLPNFSPLASLLLFTGYFVPKKYWPLPFITLFISDLVLGFYAWPVMLSVYGALTLNLYLGKFLQKHDHLLNIISGSMLSALSFFVITNLAVWLAGSWYSHDLAGLSLCFALAVPFFKNTLVSNLLYTGLLFMPVKILAAHKNKIALANK